MHKKEIAEQCLQRFLTSGIRKMTLQKIVAPLGISTKTVYKYFPDKEALLEYCLDLHYSRLLKGIEPILNSGSPVVQLFQIWIHATRADFGASHIFYHDLNYYYPRLQDKMIRKHARTTSQPVLEMFEAGIAQGYFRKDLQPPVVLEGISVIYTTLTRTDQFAKYKLAPFTLAANTVEVFLRGICTAKGLAELETNRELTSFTAQPQL
jgi:AcrR family transcriptional regulator